MEASGDNEIIRCSPQIVHLSTNNRHSTDTAVPNLVIQAVPIDKTVYSSSHGSGKDADVVHWR
jgi:hypothetical protein